MMNLKLQLIDLENLINKINSSMPDEEASISLGEFQEKTPKRSPFLYRFSEKKLEKRGKFPIYQECSGLLRNFIGIGERKIGYIFVETGEIMERKECSDVYGIYETIRLRIKKPIELENDLIIPDCSIKLLAEQEEYAAPHVERKDYTKKFGLRIRDDLSKVIPNEWFTL